MVDGVAKKLGEDATELSRPILQLLKVLIKTLNHENRFSSHNFSFRN